MHHTWIEKKKDISKSFGKIKNKLLYYSRRVLPTLAYLKVAVKIAIFLKYLKGGNNATRFPNIFYFASALNS